MNAFPGEVIDFTFECRDPAGVLTAPDATPTARLWVNGVNTAAASVQMLTDATGRVYYTLPSNAPANNRYLLSVTATIDGTADTVYGDPWGIAAPLRPLVLPLVTESGSRVSANPLVLYSREAQSITLTVVDSQGEAVDLSGLGDLTLGMARPPASVRTLNDLRQFAQSAETDADWDAVDQVEELTGNSAGQVTFDTPEFITEVARPYLLSLRVAATEEVKSRWFLTTQYAP
jgi:hypothetical protein